MKRNIARSVVLLGVMMVAIAAAIAWPSHWQMRHWRHAGRPIVLIAARQDIPSLTGLINRLLDGSNRQVSPPPMSALYAGAKALQRGSALVLIGDAALAIGDKGGTPWRIDIQAQGGKAVLGNMELYDGEIAQVQSLPKVARQVVLLRHHTERSRFELASLPSLTGGKSADGVTMKRLHQMEKAPLLVETPKGELWLTPRMIPRMHWYGSQPTFSMMQTVCHMDPTKL